MNSLANADQRIQRVAISPESQGVSTEILDNAMTYLANNARGAGADETLVIRNGYVLWPGSNIDAYHTIYSGTKAFTTTVLGLLIQEGTISSIDDPVVDYYPELDDRYPAYAGITFRQLANFTAGYNADDTAAEDMKWGDPRGYLEPISPHTLPGETFNYFDPAIHQLGNILTLASGETLEVIFRSRIATKIGMTRWEWKHCGYSDGGAGNDVVATFLNPSGIYGGGIHTSARELARFGLLYLNRGQWNGEQLITASWVDQATTNQVSTSLEANGHDARGQFGYMWWTNGRGVDGSRLWTSAPPKTYSLHGGSRNFCFVVPEWNMVIVRMSPPGLDAMPALGTPVWDTFFSILKNGVADAAVDDPVLSDNAHDLLLS